MSEAQFWTYDSAQDANVATWVDSGTDWVSVRQVTKDDTGLVDYDAAILIEDPAVALDLLNRLKDYLGLDLCTREEWFEDMIDDVVDQGLELPDEDQIRDGLFRLENEIRVVESAARRSEDEAVMQKIMSSPSNPAYDPVYNYTYVGSRSNYVIPPKVKR